MQIKKVLIHALILGVAAATYHVDTNIDWSASCTDKAIVDNWTTIRAILSAKIPLLRIKLGSAKYQQVLKLLGGITLPRTPDLQIQHGLVDIIGGDLMEDYIGHILTSYWRRHPCTEPSEPAYSASSEEPSSDEP
ncbi:hypothetical protein H4S02_012148, partial [Coemansia sp. RSA 2611]